MTTRTEQVRDRLDGVIDPCSAAKGTDLSIVEMGLLDDIEIEDGHVTVHMLLTSPACMQLPYFVDEIEERVGALRWVESVALETDRGVEWHRGMMSDEARERREERQRSLARRYLDEDPSEVAVELDRDELRRALKRE